jgi:serpin B
MNLSRRGAVAGILATAMMPCAVPAQDDLRVLTAAYNASGQELSKTFSAAPGNIVFSPYSIGTAMAMVLAGARGETEHQMAGVLRHALARDDVADANARVLAILNGYDKTKALPVCPDGMQLAGLRCEVQRASDARCPPRTPLEDALCFTTPERLPSAKVAVANALVLTRKDAPVSSEFIALVKSKFAAELFQDAGLAEINGFIAARTEGRIERILDQLDESSAAVLLNAVYFKAAWASAFSKESTREEPFSVSASQRVSVPMMHKRVTVPLVARKGYHAVRLPYVVGAIGMVVVAKVGASIDATELAALFEALRMSEPKAVSLALPRFKVTYKADLMAPLRSAGMTLAFDPVQADFSGMTGAAAGARLAIGQVVHRAVIEVQEEGTEAAAATAAVMVLTSAPSSQGTFRVDRPFLYYMVDDATGAILFQGRVVDPR